MDILKKMEDMVQSEYDGIKEYLSLMQNSKIHCEVFKDIISEELGHITRLQKMINEERAKKENK